MVESLELPVVFPFTVEDLDYLDPREVLLKRGINFSDCEPNLPECIPCLTAEIEGNIQDQRNKAETDQRQLPVDLEQYHDNANQQKNILKEIDEHPGEHFVQVLNIVGCPCHQPSNRGTIEERKG